jgi:O-antigen ligase
MQSSHHAGLIYLRLLLVYIALCLVLSQLEVAKVGLGDQTTGLPNPIFPRDPLPPASKLPFMGISIDPANFSASDPTPTFEELAAAGIGWVRVRVSWDKVEPTPRHFAWENLDRTLTALVEAKLVPVLLLDGSPAWARAPNDLQNRNGVLAPPANPASFVRFAKAVATRYGDQVRYYQIWDEPNIAPHWGARHIEPVDYARMLKAASTVIREADADAYIILAALAPTRDRGHLAQDEPYFLNRLYAAGAAPYFDGVAVQPFGFASLPDDPHIDLAILNFRRTLLIRQTMLGAGDGETPIWIMRYGWNRAPNPSWQRVSAEQQRAFTLDALAMAYHQWPWVVGMGWPAAIVPPDDPAAGFALTPELIQAFHTASTTFLTQPRPLHTPAPPLTLWTPVALWLLAAVSFLWRGVVAARELPWRRLREQWCARPAWQQSLCWALLLFLYYLGVWPPLLLLYFIIAALGFMAQPRIGLALALLVLPLYDYHKEFDWLDHHWIIPPTQAALLCLLPAIWRYRPKALARDRWNGVALGWLAVMLLSATGVWYWPAYWVGMLNLVITPLALFLLIRAWITTRQQAQTLIVALAIGGIFIAAIGLIDWMQGRGTVADGMLRLTGLGFSSNHTALYLIRTVAILVGLTLAAQGKSKWLWALATVIIGVALLLTGSRGAILLGIPTGALFIFSRQNLPLPSRRRMAGLLIVIGLGLAVMAWMWRARIANIGTMFARMDGWIVALYLWLDHFLFGVGPDGFWWTFPANMGLTSNADPNLRHPHNLWLEFATSGGLLSLLWLAVVSVLLYRWVKSKGSALPWLQVGLLAGLSASFAHAQVDAFQALAELAGWNWAALALILVLDKKPE